MEMKLSEFECADCGATINEGEYVTFGVCDKCFQKNYRERMGLPEEKKNTMENMTKEQDDELKQDIHAFTLVKALDLLDDCHHYLKANPPLKETMNYSKWENLVEETDYMREYNANAAYERANSASGSVAAPKEEFSEVEKLEMQVRGSKRFNEILQIEINNLKSELASLRQQLEQREEAIVGLLNMIDKLCPYPTLNLNEDRIKAIIERARKLISK